MSISGTQNKIIGDVFFYQSSKDILVKVDDMYIATNNIPSVQKLLKNIRDGINQIELNSKYFEEEKYKHNIEIISDIVYKCVSISKWRRGQGFVFLQISSKNSGTARVTVFTTNTIHHSSASFGTVPGSQDAKKLLTDYLQNKSKVIADIELLKNIHPTQRSASDIFNNFTVY